MTKENIEKLLTRISANELNINILKSQNSDALDFHDVNVNCLMSALKMAFEAGQVNVKNI